jgi:hypothetical protein
LFVRTASAHCDTEDGPAVTDGRRALEAGNVNIALKWVHQGDEEEVRDAFTRAVAVRDLSSETRDVADRCFLDVVIQVHRAGEGAGFDGIKPTGAHVPPQVVAADEALSLGRIDPLRLLVNDERWDELERTFDQAVALKGFDVDDLAAAREYMEAYLWFLKYAEGHDHDHEHAHAHLCGGSPGCGRTRWHPL